VILTTAAAKAKRQRTGTFMKRIKNLTVCLLAATVLAGPFTAFAAEKKAEKLKPYPLETCVVSDEEFGGDMGEPFIFAHKNREVKICCKGCKKDFDKTPAKYIKKMEAAEKKKQKSKK
jgi:hypothetical protein